MDAIALARLQFAFTVAYHFLFVPISLGSGIFLVVSGRRWYKSQEAADKAGFLFWLKLFTTTFAIGVATGITMEFAFGTNWATYSRFVGDIFGAPLAAEGIFAFFLESTFLGVLLFGRERVSRRFYYVSTWLVVLGAHLSALWIIIANSWQQTPAGFKVENGHAVLTNFFAAAFNPSTLPRYVHTVASTWVAGAFIAAGVSAFYLRRGGHTDFAKKTLTAAVIFGFVVSAAMPLIGDWHAKEVAKQQPIKMAAFEGLFTTTEKAPLTLFGVIDENGETVRAQVGVPGMLSFLLTGTTGGAVPGLDTVPKDQWPPLQATFASYHLMVLFGIYFGLVMLIGVVQLLRKKLATGRRFLGVLMWSAPLPIIAIELGWMAAEIGRQPWIVQGLLKTKDAASAVVPAGQIAFTLAVFVAIYALLFVAWFRAMRRTILHGPVEAGLAGGYAAPTPRPAPPAAIDPTRPASEVTT
jgi:cytochrome d ubiquinol oxidase subunit I